MKYFKSSIIKLLRFLVIIWKYISYPLLGDRCRFYPSCSNYFLESVEKHGLLKGAWLGVKRLSKCHPFYRDHSNSIGE